MSSSSESDLVLYLDYCFLTFALHSSYYFSGIIPATPGTLLIHFRITYIKQMEVSLSSTQGWLHSWKKYSQSMCQVDFLIALIFSTVFFLKHSRQSQEKHPAFSSMNLDNKLSTTVYQYNILWIETSYPSKVSWGNKFSYNKQFLMISIMKYIREDHSTILYPHPFSPSINILMYCVICYK